MHPVLRDHLDRYLPRNRDLAEIAITRLAEYKHGSKE
jgi:hypothetical protein